MNIEQVKNQSWETVLKYHIMDLVRKFEPEVLETVWGTENAVQVLGQIPFKRQSETGRNFECFRRAEGVAGFAFSMTGMDKYQGFEYKLLRAIDDYATAHRGYTFVDSELESPEQYAAGDLGWQITFPAGEVTVKAQQLGKDFPVVKVIESKINIRMLVRK